MESVMTAKDLIAILREYPAKSPVFLEEGELLVELRDGYEIIPVPEMEDAG